MKMLISICIPQYNRINFLLESLRILEKQTYEFIEVVISDDCSTDGTEMEILKLKETYKYPIVYTKHSVNLGYDRNLRASIELAKGEYILILGNDDTLNPEFDIKELAEFILNHQYPSVGFINYMDAGTKEITRRAQRTAILGSGPEVALKYYSCFSFVAGIVFKRSTFLQYNTNRFDGSIFTQIYLSCIPIARGEVLFSLKNPLIIKDVLPEAQNRVSFIDTLPRTWKEYKTLDAGLPSVMSVVLSVFRETGTITQTLYFKAFRKIYTTTLPYWILEYKKQKAFPAAVGIFRGLTPPSMPWFNELHASNRIKIKGYYYFMSFMAFLFPVILFERIKPTLYNLIKK